jgi:hypothetical protein
MTSLFHIKRISLLCALFVAGVACAQVQQSGEPIQAPDEVTLGGFEGCTIAPPKDGCNARIKCSGFGRIYGTSPYAVQDATKEAQAKARAQLAKFYSEKVKAKESIANASEASGQSNASGGADVKESFSRVMAEVTQTSAEAVLSGFQVLGRQVDMAQKTVTIKGGVSCKSQAAAAQSQAASARSAPPVQAAPAAQAGQPQNPGAAAVSVGPSNMKTVNQKVKNADDF